MSGTGTWSLLSWLLCQTLKTRASDRMVISFQCTRGGRLAVRYGVLCKNLCDIAFYLGLLRSSTLR